MELPLDRSKWFVFLILLVCMNCSVFGQVTTGHADKDTSYRLNISHTLPEFKGGMTRLTRIIEENMEYPKQDRKAGIGGRVVTQFVVDTFGKVVDIKVIEGVSPDIDKEAVRLVGLLKNWIPGTQAGKKVNVLFTLPMTFSPSKRPKKDISTTKNE